MVGKDQHIAIGLVIKLSMTLQAEGCCLEVLHFWGDLHHTFPLSSCPSPLEHVDSVPSGQHFVFQGP